MVASFSYLGLAWQWPLVLTPIPAYLLLATIAGLLHRWRTFRLARLGYYLPRGFGLRSSSRTWLYGNLRWYCGLTLLTIAVAGPIWGKNQSADIAAERNLILVVDLSRSMLATDVLPDRCRRACAAIESLCDHLQKRGGVRLALVAFAGKGELLCPLTSDYDHVRQLAASLDPAAPPSGTRPDQPGTNSGTRIGSGLLSAAAAVDDEARPFTDVIVLSDGDDPARDQEYRAGIDAFQASGVPVHVIGIGNPQANWDLTLPVRRGGKQSVEHVATSLKEAPLREIAQATHGVYVPARTEPCDLAALYDDIIEPLPRADSSTNSITQPPTRRNWFLALALVCFLMEFVRSGLGFKRSWFSWRRAVDLPHPAALAWVLLALVSLAAAFPDDAESLLQSAYRAFDAGRYQDAQNMFAQAKRLTGDPGFAALDEALASLRLGQYEEAMTGVKQCLEDAGPERRPIALMVRGICRFRRAGQDRASLRKAAADFQAVIHSPGVDQELARFARQNLELTRLVLAEATPPNSQNQKPGSENERSGGEDEGNDGSDRPGDKRGLPTDASKGNMGADQGDKEANLLSNPGRGNLPLKIGDSGNAMSTSDALEILASAEKRIEAELLEQRRQRVLDVNAPKKDW